MGVNNNFCNVADCNIFLQMNRVGRCEWGCRLLLRCSGTTGQDYFLNAKYTAPKTQAKLSK